MGGSFCSEEEESKVRGITYRIRTTLESWTEEVRALYAFSYLVNLNLTAMGIGYCNLGNLGWGQICHHIPSFLQYFQHKRQCRVREP